MKEELLDIICCPECHSKFDIINRIDREKEIVSGSLFCGRCNIEYPILDGLPIILKNIDKQNTTQKAFSEQWKLQNDGYFEKNTIYGESEEDELIAFKEAFEIIKSSDLSGKIILDAGCGSGRLTKYIGMLAKDSTVIGFDFSNAAKVAYNRCKDVRNVHIIQCDLLYPPFKAYLFDYVWSEGVIVHTLNSFNAFTMLDRLVATNGRLYIWVYPKNKFSPYRFARDILYKPYLLPSSLIYRFSWLFAVPSYCFTKFLGLIKVIKKKYKLKTLVFGYFDNLSPEFQHRHTKAEVRNWFSSHNYQRIKIIGDIGAVGIKTR